MITSFANFALPQTAADEEEPTGNNRFEGFCVDLLEQIANQVGFNYQIELVEDNNYGAVNFTTGEWNGLVRVRTFYFSSGSSKIAKRVICLALCVFSQ